ncbi:endonuclease/exonuclease/phosphatase family protein [Aquimarina sp. 2201CG14-23]|uniref:endonuclease/exonuclease/phosphatase family protein n=1 Tax=Aquimarina mycalae TaxID=3040073 RepID=UPI002477FFB8|nr:endonuclease/exonuclease/phosphatase family protein [Aquimarina sp. 2201CG14-23]MDH7446296.1 endonuclease/exonuclease/phosphatase family protein [Aquimarina sp. 2201CG14-23]
MNSKYLLTIAFVLSSIIVLFSQEKKTYKVNTIAFYNLENLFDTENDPITFDDDRTPNGKDHWTEDIYKDKLKNMAKVISEIGADVTKNAPAIVGVAEIENRKVLEDLANEPALLPKDYGIVQFDSPDRRGIDVALLYQKSLFRPVNTSVHELLIYNNNDTKKRVYTRDQLLVSGYLDGDLIHVIVNHWPSRSGGEARSRYKREKAAALNKKIIDSLFDIDPYAKVITMGDLNDDPDNASVKKVLAAKAEKEDVKLKGLYNPMYNMSKKGIGSLAWRDSWNLFDQIIVSKGLLDKDYSSYKYYKAGVFNKNYLANPRGRYKGYPYRSFANGAYTGGYSDHFPVYVYLIKEM